MVDALETAVSDITASGSALVTEVSNLVALVQADSGASAESVQAAASLEQLSSQFSTALTNAQAATAAPVDAPPADAPPADTTTA